MATIYDFSDGALEKQIGQFLRDVRIKNNLTQLEAARLSGVHRNTVSSIEGGAGGTVSTLVQLLRTYKYLHLIEPMKPLPIELSPIQLWKLQLKRKRKVKHRVKKWLTTSKEIVPVFMFQTVFQRILDFDIWTTDFENQVKNSGSPRLTIKNMLRLNSSKTKVFDLIFLQAFCRVLPLFRKVFRLA